VPSSQLGALVAAAEAEWLDRWTTGPLEPEGDGLPAGAPAPDVSLLDDTGRVRSLAEFWSGQSALVLFWRHFGCGCGIGRAERLKAEWADYAAAGLRPVIVAQGEPERAAAYREEHGIPCPILCDPDHAAYRAFGIGQWSVERILFEAPPEFWDHPHQLGVDFQDGRRAQGRPLVDDPWRAVKEFVIGPNGVVRLTYSYQYCEDFPNPRVLTAAARLADPTT
jgi:peroxiredoxin